MVSCANRSALLGNDVQPAVQADAAGAAPLNLGVGRHSHMSAVAFVVFFTIGVVSSLAYTVAFFVVHSRISQNHPALYEKLGKPSLMDMHSSGYRSLWKMPTDPQSELSESVQLMRSWSRALWVLWLATSLAFVGVAAAFIALWQR